MRENCIYLEAEDIGGIPPDIQYGYYCRKLDLYNDDINCDNCKEYRIE